MDLFENIIKGDHIALSKTITLLESTLDKDQILAQKILSKCSDNKKSIRIGITGVPGVGKSTFINSLGKNLINQGKKVAVLAIDPSSEKSKGSILGDKSRMHELASENNAFIRPSPSSGTLGGITNKTKDAILLCENAGFDIILVETVGVGQNETTVGKVVDITLLLVLTGAGDELQTIKRGIIEVADIIIVNKSDGDNIQKSKNTKIQYEATLHLINNKDKHINVYTCSSIKNTGINEIWSAIKDYFHKSIPTEKFLKNRTIQNIFWIDYTLKHELGNKKYNNLKNSGKLKVIQKKIINKEVALIDILEELY